jgi:hypothetical protein
MLANAGNLVIFSQIFWGNQNLIVNAIKKKEMKFFGLLSNSSVFMCDFFGLQQK